MTLETSRTPEEFRFQSRTAGRLQADAYAGRAQFLLAFQDGDREVPPPPPPGAEIKAPTSIAWSDADKEGKRTGTVEHNEFGYKLKLTTADPSNPDALTAVETDFGGKPPTRHYEKRQVNGKGVWYQVLDGGKLIAMQGDLRVNSETGEFTQVLRRDLDDKGTAVKETTRTMSRDGTDTIHRMDGSSSIFEHATDGKPTKWTEKGKDDNVVGEFTAEVQKDGQVKWTGKDGSIRWNATVEDNGNVTWTDDPNPSASQKPANRHVETSAGDHIVDGFGAKYTFNCRGDVTSIKFDQPRDFEQHKVDRIDLTYSGDGRKVNGLTLIRNNQILGYFSRGHTQGGDDNVWLTYDGYGRQLFSQPDQAGNRRPHALYGDYAIQDGFISTTERNAGFDVEGKKPEFIKWTYRIDPVETTDASGKHTTAKSGYTVEAVPGVEMLVPGETGYGGSAPIEVRPAPEEREAPQPPSPRSKPNLRAEHTPDSDEELQRELDRYLV